MAAYPPSYPPPPSNWKQQRRMIREQERLQRQYLRAQQTAQQRQMRGRARGSIVGPLLVVGLGVLVLLVQLGRIPTTWVLDWYGRWWPILLIGVGALLLTEWAWDRWSDKELPRRSIGPGVVTLIALLAVGGIAARGNGLLSRDFVARGFQLDSDNFNEFLGDKHESDGTYVEDAGPGMGITVQNPRGDVTVSGTSTDGKVHLQVHREIFTRSDADASSKAEQLRPSFTTSAGALSVTLPLMDGARTDLIFTVPPASAETLTSDHGDVRVTQLSAPVTIVANHGDVELSEVAGAISIHINNGDSSFSGHKISGPLTVAGKGRDVTLSDVRGSVSLAGDFFGTTHLERISGQVLFHTSRTDMTAGHVSGEVEVSPDADLSASNVAGPFILNTRNRNITLDHVSGDISVTNRNGSVDVNSILPLGHIAIENRNGSVDLSLPPGQGFTLQASTTDGDIQSAFPVSLEKQDAKQTLAGTVGAGGPSVNVTTTQADITIKRDDVRTRKTDTND